MPAHDFEMQQQLRKYEQADNNADILACEVTGDGVCAYEPFRLSVPAAEGEIGNRPQIATDGQRLILPAFGAYAGGLNVRDAAFAGMFGRQPLAGVLGPSRVRAIGWRQLVGD